jgi:RNA 2',3'-cyclic 3'-phosphodiesterase
VIRAFIAVIIDPQIIQRIRSVTAELRPKLPEFRWVNPANLHITLKFLGNIEAEQVDPIAEALKGAVRAFPPFSINAKGLGVFPGITRARVLWIGLEDGQLTRLAQVVEDSLQKIGFPPEQRGFQPHLTIGRWRQPDVRNKYLLNALEKWRGYEFGTSHIDSIVLFQSILSREGARYEALRTIPMADK